MQSSRIGAQRQVVDARHRCKSRRKIWQVSPHERLATRKSDTLQSTRCHNRDQALDFLEPQPRGRFLKPTKPLWNAVGAAQVASVGDRKPQVLNSAPERVYQEWGLRSHNDVAAALARHEKRVTERSLMIRPESLIREVPVQMKGLSPAGSQSQPGTKRFAATGTQFD
jgi:hypothetical protein